MIALIDEYRKELLQIATFADKTVQNYVSCLLTYWEFAKESLGINPIESKGSHIQDWMIKVKEKGLSASRLQHHQSALKIFFAFLVKRNLVKENPVSFMAPIRRRKSDRNKPIPNEVAYTLLASIDQTSWLGKRNFLIISVLWALGLRLSELTSLRVGDFEAVDSKKKIGLLRVRGKNRKQRVLFVVEKLYDHMICYLVNPESPKKKSAPLFPAQDRAISVDRVQRMIKEYAAGANIKERITPHVLRHSFATQMYHRKVPLSAIQAMMGHTSIDETTIYIHVSGQLQKEALEHITLTGGIGCRF